MIRQLVRRPCVPWMDFAVRVGMVRVRTAPQDFQDSVVSTALPRSEPAPSRLTNAVVRWVTMDPIAK